MCPWLQTFLITNFQTLAKNLLAVCPGKRDEKEKKKKDWQLQNLFALNANEKRFPKKLFQKLMIKRLGCFRIDEIIS